MFDIEGLKREVLMKIMEQIDELEEVVRQKTLNRLYWAIAHIANISPVFRMSYSTHPLREIITKALHQMNYENVRSFDRVAQQQDYDQLIALCRRYAKHWTLA